MPWCFSPTCSSRSFKVLGLTYMSLIFFESTFVYDVKLGSNFILLHENIHFSQHHFLKTVFFPILWCWHTCRRWFACLHDFLFLSSILFHVLSFPAVPRSAPQHHWILFDLWVFAYALPGVHILPSCPLNLYLYSEAQLKSHPLHSPWQNWLLSAQDSHSTLYILLLLTFYCLCLL